MPGSPSSGAAVPQCLSQVWAERGTPDPDRLVTDVDTTLKKQFLHIAVREQKTVVKVNRVANDGLGEAVLFGPFARLEHRASLPQSNWVDATASPSPQRLDLVTPDERVVGHQREPLELGLGDQQPVERVAVVRGQAVVAQRVAHRDGQHPERVPL